MQGYGRGYYGGQQLAPRRRSGGGWFKIALVVGLGAAAVIWLKWPRKKIEFSVPPPSAPPPDPAAVARTAYDRGFSSPTSYEDAIVDNARQLQATGARVELAPHLQYLQPRLGPGPS